MRLPGFFSLFVLLTFTVALAQVPQLPPVGSDGKVGPLAVNQLNAEESASFAKLAPGSAESRQFLYTRGYLRFCSLVVEGKLPARSLPELPARADWDRRFLNEKERKIVDDALGMNIAVTLGPRPPAPPASAFAGFPGLPSVGADGKIAPLAVSQLSAEERAYFAKLTPGSLEARQFLYTRGFLRFCELVVEGKLPPLSLPDLPAREDWNRGFLSEKEAKGVVDVALGMNLMASMMKSQRK
jgi:hypothetical protein